MVIAAGFFELPFRPSHCTCISMSSIFDISFLLLASLTNRLTVLIVHEHKRVTTTEDFTRELTAVNELILHGDVKNLLEVKTCNLSLYPDCTVTSNNGNLTVRVTKELLQGGADFGGVIGIGLEHNFDFLSVSWFLLAPSGDTHIIADFEILCKLFLH